jgi:hypothetical protein
MNRPKPTQAATFNGRRHLDFLARVWMGIQLMWAILSLSFEPPASAMLLATPGALLLKREILRTKDE